MEQEHVINKYDPFAWFYNRYWGSEYHARILPILDRAVLSKLPEQAHVLDLCCGAGHLARILNDRGFRVTGIDSSSEMLRYAETNAPGAKFMQADVREFRLEYPVDAVVCTFESLNHMMSTEDLFQVFENVCAALAKGGSFFFDLLTETAYRKNWMKSSTQIENDNVCIVQGGYDEQSKTGRSEITMFRFEKNWVRTDLLLVQKYHPPDLAEALLKRAGLMKTCRFLAGEDFEMPGDLGLGRLFFLATKGK